MKKIVVIAALVSTFIFSTSLVAAPVSDQKSAAHKATATQPNPRSLEANEQGIAELRTGNTRSAEEKFRRALEVDRGNLTAAFNLAGVLVVNGKKLEAIALLSEYEKKYDFDPGMSVRLGDTLFSSEKVKEAIIHYEKAFAIDPNYSRLAEKLALAYALTQRFKDSEKMYRIALKNSPKDPEILANLSSVTLGNGNAADSITFAQQAIQIKPSSRVYVTLGSALEAKGDPKAALNAYKRAKELGSTDADLGKKIEMLESHLG